MLERVFSAEEVREDIRAKCAFDLLLGDVLELFQCVLFGGVIHENVPTAELLHRVGDKLPANFFLTDVARNREALAAFFLNEVHGVPGVLVFVQIPDHDICTFAREKYGDGPADSAIPTSNECNFVLELARSTIFDARHLRARLHLVLFPWLMRLRLRRALRFGIFFLAHTRSTAAATPSS